MTTNRIRSLWISVVLTVFVLSPTWADDTEIFFGSNNGSGSGNPNIMLILDTSGSMSTTVTTYLPFDPTASYNGNCSDNNIYYSLQQTNTVIPTCSTGGAISNGTTTRGYIDKNSFYCSSATDSNGAFRSAGYLQDAGIRWITTATQVGSASPTYTYAWNSALNPANNSFTTGHGQNRITTTITYTKGAIACKSHNYDQNYPNNYNPTSTTKWTSNASYSYWPPSSNAGTETQYVFYSASYLNWYANYRAQGSLSRLSIIQSAAKSLIDSLNNVNLGLMRYDAKANGGMVMAPILDVVAQRSLLKTEIDTWKPSGGTPLTETLSETYRYFSGSTVNYGNTSYKCNLSGGCSSSSDYTLTPSVASSRSNGNISGTTYKSPMNYSCQKNYVVYLTDGLPNGDAGADTFIKSLDPTNASSAACYTSNSNIWTSLGVTDPNTTSNSTTDGTCLKKLASYMYSNDLSTTLSNKQNVTTNFIGFGSDVANGSSFAYLRDASIAGGGNAYTATDLTSLTNTLNEIILSIREDSTTFTSPSVAVNAFNKTQVLEDIYISVFQPSLKTHWLGNVKKYKMRDGKIIGQDTSVSAIDTTTGFFNSTSQSYWSDSVDGLTTASGGAANEIPEPASRKVYTYIGSDPSIGNFPDLSSNLTYSVEDSNTTITSSILNIGNAGDPSRTNLINWIRGQDINDDNNNQNTTEARHVMGDPIHSQPAVVIYGNTGSTTTEQLNDAVVYVSTNDGYLHGFDVSTGTELWSFIPQNLLSEQISLYTNPSSNTKHYALDGNIRVLKYDINGDGKIDASAGDRVFLYCGQGRGGDRYYALDVTNKTHPKYMWNLSSTSLGNIVQQSWSTPTLGRIKIKNATQNPQKLVLVFTAGYDTQHESSQGYRSVGDAYGNGLYIVDAVRGTVLWSQTKTSTGAFSNMTHAIPSDLAVLDTNTDGWTDRMYVGDMVGQLWRFDITNGNTANDLVAGGVIASLGAKAESTPSTANNRRFYNQPDVAKLMSPNGIGYYNVSIGSGDRAHPKLNTTTVDRFYAIRDYHLEPMSQATYDAYTPIKESDLTAISGTSLTSISGNGWMLTLSASEKVLAQSITVNGSVMFITYLPTGSINSCSVSTGSGRAYAVNISTGYKYFSNLYESFTTTGLPSQITIVNQAGITRTDGTTASSSSTSSTSSSSSSAGATPTPASGACLSGVNILGNCMQFGSMVKTFWQESGAY